ncbi:hypothetical protein M3215_22735 [Bacillus cytotoxicus]|uniref:Uncharacterized protein n=1 Tax=Bacillus cytotoxicus TaxID=580165 RepID=A0ACC6ACW6_9BACI|nr:hypothetical protein [Bacillus cytotoxicus]
MPEFSFRPSMSQLFGNFHLNWSTMFPLFVILFGILFGFFVAFAVKNKFND